MSDLTTDAAIAALEGLQEETSEAPEVVEDTQEDVDAAEDADIDEIDEQEFSPDSDSPSEQSEEDDEEGPEEATDDVGDEESDEPEAPAIEPPPFLDENGKTDFAKLPREAQQIVERQSKLLQADHTRKSQETAELRKQLETRMNTVSEVVSEKEQMLGKMQEALSEWQQVNWVELKRTLPPEDYADAEANHKTLQNDYFKLKNEHDNLRAQQNQVREQELNTFKAERNQILTSEYPDFLDQKKGPELVMKVRDELLAKGTPPEKLQEVGAHEMGWIVDALKWRDYQKQRQKKPLLKSKPSAAKTKGKPARSKPRAQSSATAVPMQRFSKNPSRDNAVNALMNLDD